MSSVSASAPGVVRAATAPTARADGPGRLAVFAVAALFLGVGSGDRVPLFLADVVLAIAVAGSLRQALRSSTRHGLRFPATFLGRSLMAAALALTLSLAIHPSPVGVITTLRYFALLVTVPAFGRILRSDPRFVGGVLAILGSLEAAVVLAQGLLGRRVGLGLLEAPYPFRSYGGRALAPLGTIHHADLQGWLLASVAAALVLLTLRFDVPLKWTGPTVALGAAAAVASYRRVTVLEWAGLGALLLAVAATRPRLRQRALALAGSMLLGVAVLIPHAWSGWTDRADIISQAETPFDSGRSALLPEAVALLKTAPVVGVGPVQYLPSLLREHPKASTGTIIHVVPILMVVEGGLLSGTALAAVAVAIGLRVARRRPTAESVLLAAGISAPLVAMSALTPLPTMYAIGPLLTALNLAMALAALAPRVGVPDASDASQGGSQES